MTPRPSPVAALAVRARLTEGQLYSSVITLVVAALLATGLGDVHGVVSSALSQAPLALPAAPAAALPPITVPTPVAAVPAPAPMRAPVQTAPSYAGFLPQPQPAPSPQPPPPSPAPSATPTASPSPCTAQPVDDAGRQAILTADAAAGGGLPDEQLLTLLHLVTGCPAAGSPSPQPSTAAVLPGVRP
jgi:predicted component of type VI protein secretion system